MTRLLSKVLPLLCLMMVLAQTLAAPATTSRPNIIFILADDLGYGDLGCYGQKKIRTPNLDRLAAEGLKFTSVYAGSTVCAPSRAVLMTGLHTGHVRIRGNGKVPLKPEDVTVAELLKKGGYRTAAFGKWGLGNPGTTGTPNKKGFDEWFGYLDQTHAHDYYTDYLYRNENKIVLSENQDGRKQLYTHDYFTRAALNFISASSNQAFFLYLPYTIPHANNERKEKGMEVPSDEPYSKETWPEPERNKAAMITRMDAHVGLILENLKKLKLEEKTIIFFTSDNGPHKEGGVNVDFFQSSGPLRGIKRDMYEGGIRVPMIARWKGKIKAGTVSDEPWSFADFLPTACEIAGVNPMPKVDGISYLATLLGRKQKERQQFFYWEFHEKGFKQAVRMGDWKAVRLEPGKPLDLYNLAKDLGETQDVAAKEPAIVARIEDYLKTARTDSPDWPLKPGPAKTP